MRALAAFLVMALIVVLVMPSTSSAIELDEVLQKHIEAKGGMEKLKSVNSMQMYGKSHMRGVELPFTTFHMRPDKLRIETTIQGQSIVQGYDGETGWYVNPMSGSSEPQEMSARAVENLKVQADIDGFLIDSEEKGYKVEYVGEGDVEGTPSYQLRVSDTADLDVDVYLDAEYFVELKWTVRGENEGNVFSLDMFFSDYKDVDGMMLAHAMATQTGGQLVNEMTIDSVVINPELDPAIFQMPSVEEKAGEGEK